MTPARIFPAPRAHSKRTQRMISPRLLCAGLAFGLMAATAASAEPVKVNGFTHVKSLDGIDEYRLDANGLSVLLLPNHAAPVVTFQVTYRVGSRNEVTGSTGGTHLLEHLMFMGSTHFDGENNVDTYLDRVGAGFNATTSLDRTNYYATLPPAALDGYIAIEADRMRGLLLREKDRQSEMTVVRNEYERNENNPNGALMKLMWATAFSAHPYHHPVIGWRSDIEKVSIEKLREFYDTFYWPNNATVTVVGDIDSAKVLASIGEKFGKVPRSPHAIPEVYTTEPEQQGERRVTLRRAGETGTVMMAYKAPAGVDKDIPALNVLELVLQGGRSARLPRALVDTSKAVAVSGGMYQQRDPSLFMLSVALAPDSRHEDIEKTVRDEIAKVARDGVTVEEIKRVLGPYRAEEAYRRDGTDQAADALNEFIAMGDWTLYSTALKDLEKVTPADVQRVAGKYFTAEQSTVGWFVPESSK